MKDDTLKHQRYNPPVRDTGPHPTEPDRSVPVDVHAKPEPVEIPEFLAEKAPEIPADLTDLIDVADTPAETNVKLLAKWNEANGLIQLAHDRGERPSMDLIRKRDRLESGIRWNRGRLAEQI